MARRHRSEGLTIYATLYLLFLYGPVLLLPLFSFNDSYYVAFPLRSFTFAWYRQMAENTPLLEALQASLKVAVSVAVISTVLGVLAAKALTRYDLPGRAPITGFIMLPLVIPSLVLALALLVVLRRILDVELSLYTVTAGHLMLCVPYAMLVMISRLEGFDRSLEEASSDLGDNAWQTFWRITLPAIRWGVAYGVVLTTARVLGEFGAVTIVSGSISGETETLPLFVAKAFEQFNEQAAYAGAIVLALLALTTLLLMSVGGRKAKAPAGAKEVS
jgi:spermidine/putrescine transport system permease protein